MIRIITYVLWCVWYVLTEWCTIGCTLLPSVLTSLSLSLFILPSSSSSSLLLLLLPPTQVICFRSNLIEKIEGIEHLASTLQSLELNDNRVQSLRGVGGNTALEYVNRLNRVLE